MSIKIGILNSTYVLRTGGGFQYITSLIEGLRQYSDFKIIVYYDDPLFSERCVNSPNLEFRFIKKKSGATKKIKNAIAMFLGMRLPFEYWDVSEYGEKPDLLISQESLIGFYTGIPCIGFIGDVSYRHFPNLSEYPFKHRFIRNVATKRLAEKSVFTVVDSQQGKKDLINFYQTNPDKLVPIPLCAPPHIYKYQNMSEGEISTTLNKYNLPPEFIYYPAQFWEHKNHIRLIKALHLLSERHGKEIPAVFVGSAWESHAGVINLIKELGMEEQVSCLGYLPERDIVALYKKATALVFASFADYTAIPIVEAMVLGTPVVCSNSFSMPEQVGDSGLLFDPFNVENMAEKIHKIWTDEGLRRTLIAKGHKKALQYSISNFAQQWRSVILDAIAISR